MARPTLLGQDFAGIFAENLGPLFSDATLTKKVIGNRGTDITAGNAGTPVNHPCKAISQKKLGRVTQFRPHIDPTQIRGRTAVIYILGGSLPDDVDPAPDDIITYEGKQYVISGDVDDPANGTIFGCPCDGPP